MASKLKRSKRLFQFKSFDAYEPQPGYRKLAFSLYIFQCTIAFALFELLFFVIMSLFCTQIPFEHLKVMVEAVTYTYLIGAGTTQVVYGGSNVGSTWASGRVPNFGEPNIPGQGNTYVRVGKQKPGAPPLPEVKKADGTVEEPGGDGA